jgi:hypothetical protein
VPIPASATSFTDTLALGLICSAKYLLHIFISTKKNEITRNHKLNNINS